MKHKKNVKPKIENSKLMLSVIMPVFNEEQTVREVIRNVLRVRIPNVVIELIVVDDGSSDGSYEAIKKKVKRGSKIKVVRHRKNKGKGSAVQAGIAKATGDYVVVQDADLEYDPEYFALLLQPILNREAYVVYGTRLNRLPHLFGEERRPQFLLHYIGNRLLSLITSVLYGVWITDMETCYKLFPRSALDGVKLRSKGFEFEPEITSVLLQKGYPFTEVPIVTKPRGYEEGKKLNTFQDGVKALRMLITCRLW